MNGLLLDAGHALDAKLKELQAEAIRMVADVTDVWPGRRDEALIHEARFQAAAQTARTELGTLVLVLAQDGSP